jgi:hypothetical protein
MTAPVIPNQAAVAAILIDPTNGIPYRPGQADTPSVLPIPNQAALACSLIDPITGLPYR